MTVGTKHGSEHHEWRARPRRRRCQRGRVATLLVGGLLAAGALGCGVGGEGELPPNVPDPATVQNPTGALKRYRAALAQVPRAFSSTLSLGGILTDELAAMSTPFGIGGAFTGVDARLNLESYGLQYGNRLQSIRAQAREARGFLGAYAPDSSPALQGHLYAMEAYAQILLADLFCSGIPLSTVDFAGDYTLKAGSTTSEVYTDAVTLLDSALALTGDSARLQHFAAIAKGRALLANGRYADAAAAVGAVPDGYRYELPFNHANTFTVNSAPDSALLWYFKATYTQVPGTPSMADREGQNGLDYRSSGDPRTRAIRQGMSAMYFPLKYESSGSVVFTLADAVEARLIEAEAALQEGGDWLGKLNALRTDGTFTESPTPAPDDDPSATDTLWNAGTGGVAGLAPLVDPGNTGARVDLLFRERAFWLYLTAHRQGDLRRLIRQYLRAPNAVYPTGSYPGASGMYGEQIVVPMPEEERQLNPKYTGCFHRNA